MVRKWYFSSHNVDDNYDDDDEDDYKNDDHESNKDEEDNYDKNNHNKDEQNKENPFFYFVLLATCFLVYLHFQMLSVLISAFF